MVESIPLHWNKVYIAKEKNEEQHLMIQRLPITRSLIWDPWSEFRVQHALSFTTPFQCSRHSLLSSSLELLALCGHV